MGVISWLKGVINKLFKREIEKRFAADIQLSDVMGKWIDTFYKITEGNPPWENADDDIESINFAGFIDDVTAGLVTLDLGVEFPNTPRGKNLQKQWEYVSQVIQDKVSEGLGNCGMMFKPNGKNVDYIEPGNFIPTDTDSNGNILGCVFQSRKVMGKNYYTRLEWHRFEGETYRITNYCYKGTEGSIGDPCPLTEVDEWAHLQEESYIGNVKSPLFAYFKNPAPNRLDRSSALGVPIWHNALKELKNLDKAWSRMQTEIEDSKHITFVPENALMYARQNNVVIPRWLKGLQTDDDKINEHVSTLLTAERIQGINSILAMISTKCGFSQGFFVLDEKTGRMTATQVEADDQQTVDTINNIHNALKDTLLNLFYALDKMQDIDEFNRYGAVRTAVEWDKFKEQIVISYHDFTANPDEDRLRALNLTREQFYAKWYYLHKYEGYTEEEAKQRVLEALEEAKQLAESESSGGWFEEE